MPKLKVDHVVSFSTEDPVHVANNLISIDTSKKWKCQSAGEKSAVIVLQLEKASIISSIDIGNEHSAYVEVLVQRSGTTEDFRVLLVMSSFMSPLEARQSTNGNKVRMFTYNELQSPERDQKWDRVKIVCTQPFNRHIQYGLSFVTLHYLEAKDSNVAGQVKLGNFALRPKSPDILSVGSLFARRKELTDEAPLTAAAAIREAASRTSLGQGSPQCKPRLKDTLGVASKKDTLASNSRSTTSGDGANADTPRSRNRQDLLYSKDEEEPNHKIDKLIEQKNKEAGERRERNKEEEAKKKEKKQKLRNNSSRHGKDDDVSVDPGPSSSSSTSNKQGADHNKRKLNGKDTPHKKIKVDRRVKPFNELLSGVTIVISGIQNPERANIRTEALALGAKYKADWEDSCCTHLICAFTNTPKFNQVKGKGKIVNRIWIQDCYNQRKRLPWRRYALDIKDQNKDESEDEVWEQKAKSPDIQIISRNHEDDADDDDTTDAEDEIDRLQALQKAEDKIINNCFSVDTDEESSLQRHNNNSHKNPLPELPDFFSNKVLYVDKQLSEKTRSLLTRYITAFKGILVDEPGDVVDFAISDPKSADILRGLCPDAQVLSPEWIWECHNEKQLLPFAEYQL